MNDTATGIGRRVQFAPSPMTTDVTARYLAELREIDGNYIRLNRDADPYATAYCPLCRCNKSGDAEQANSVCEPCENTGCPCHADAAAS